MIRSVVPLGVTARKMQLVKLPPRFGSVDVIEIDLSQLSPKKRRQIRTNLLPNIFKTWISAEKRRAIRESKQPQLAAATWEPGKMVPIHVDTQPDASPLHSVLLDKDPNEPYVIRGAVVTYDTNTQAYLQRLGRTAIQVLGGLRQLFRVPNFIGTRISINRHPDPRFQKPIITERDFKDAVDLLG